ncbi:MAG: dockerin type I repeat-containing protein [Armatimonadetes bacterium]|nr:dockerin type I repeat-containing protein [Armatimonadota bacterium]
MAVQTRVGWSRASCACRWDTIMCELRSKRAAVLGVVVAAALMVLAWQDGADAQSQFRRGDINADGEVNVTDPVALLDYLFAATDAPPCKDAADVNDDGKVEISDPVRLLGFLFLGLERPPDPFTACGVDSTGDELDCTTFDKCP